MTDWLALPAGVYFLWVMQALYRGTYRDWNSTGRALLTRPGVGASSAPPDVPATA